MVNFYEVSKCSPSARSQWEEAYRAARSAYKLYDTFRDRFNGDFLPPFLVDAWHACPGFCATRLFPDMLGMYRMLHLRALHPLHMMHLSYRVRLPA